MKDNIIDEIRNAETTAESLLTAARNEQHTALEEEKSRHTKELNNLARNLQTSLNHAIEQALKDGQEYYARQKVITAKKIQNIKDLASSRHDELYTFIINKLLE